MVLPFKLRALSFAGAIVLLVVVIASVAQLTWKQINDLQRKLSEVNIESFRISDHFQATIQELDYTLFSFEVHNDTNEYNSFLTSSTNLDKWIDSERPTLTSEREGKILDAINVAYDDYLKAAKHFGAEKATANQERSLANFTAVEKESKHLLDLGYELATAHRDSLIRFIGTSQHSLSLLRTLIFSSLLLLLGCASWLAAMVYREMIKPLRLKLQVSEALILRQEKLASLGVLAAGVAHEIRNPLTAIKARLFTQQKALRRGSQEYEDATIIGSEINRLEKIVRDFLLFARPADPHRSQLTSQAAFADISVLLSAELQRKGIELKTGSISETSFEADPHQLKQVLLNLVQNAAESIGRNGTIILCSHDEIRKGVAWVVLEVRDTGKGISPAVEKRLFDPFFSTKEAGTGLGLSIAARIVEKHGGSIQFQSEVERGTIFQIALPLTIP